MQNRCFFKWFCMIHAASGGCFFLTGGFFELADTRDHYFSIGFHVFAEFMCLMTVSPADGQSARARCVESLLFPMVLQDACSIRGCFFLRGWFLIDRCADSLLVPRVFKVLQSSYNGFYF